MKRIPFDPKELIPIGEEPGFMPGMPGRPIFPTPITPRENYLMLLSGEVPLWMPAGMSDSTMMTCKLAENVARGFVFEAERIDNNTEAGGPDFFGVEWEYIKTVGGSMVKPGAIVIDVGIRREANGRLRGDVDFDSASKVAGWITPVPGGVGKMTITMLLANTVEAAERTLAK